MLNKLELLQQMDPSVTDLISDEETGIIVIYRGSKDKYVFHVKDNVISFKARHYNGRSNFYQDKTVDEKATLYQTILGGL